MTMRAASLCSGIGAPEAALPEWDWLWCAEVEPTACAVLDHHYPRSENLGDILADDFIARAIAAGIPDVLFAGTPCQAFSVAGLRGGLTDDRGNLMLRALQIFEGLCDAARSRGLAEPIFVFENVPGILSDATNAFGCFLGALGGDDTALVPPRDMRWTDAGVAAGPNRTVVWRVLDAQFFGLAQRRKRVFAVGCSGERCDPVPVLLESSRVRGNPPPRRTQGERVAATIGAGIGSGSGDKINAGALQVANPLGAKRDGGWRGDLDNDTYTLAISGRGDGHDLEWRNDGTANAILTPNGGRGGIGVGAIATPLTAVGSAVRRLTPLECLRLQGFPDSYFDAVLYRGKALADGPRYRLLGNSMAVPVIRWIGERIEEACDV